jgi:hypothetical protein
VTGAEFHFLAYPNPTVLQVWTVPKSSFRRWQEPDGTLTVCYWVAVDLEALTLPRNGPATAYTFFVRHTGADSGGWASSPWSEDRFFLSAVGVPPLPQAPPRAPRNARAGS